MSGLKQRYWRPVAVVLVLGLMQLGCASDGSLSRTQKGAMIGGASGAAVGGLIGSKKARPARAR